MKLLGLNRVELLVNDPDQAERDLSALLGGEDGLSFEREPAEGVLDCRVDWKAGIEIVHPESDEHVVGQLLKGKGEHIFTVVFEVDDIEAVSGALEAAGGEILGIRDMGDHGKTLSFRDPDGNLVQLYQRAS